MLSCGVVSGQAWSGNGEGSSRFSVIIPDSMSLSAGNLVSFIQQQYHTPKTQLQAAYSWITRHIRYNSDSTYFLNRNLDHDTRIAVTLRRRKGVCENYADLFADLATRIGFTAYVVYGYPLGISMRTNTGHAWCAVNVDDAWWLFDPTWDATQPGNLRYFMVSPEIFIQSHMPFDPLWQLLERPVNFGNNNAGKKNIFHYRDSVKVFLQLDSLQQCLAIERRMRNAGANNQLIRLWQGYNRMNIAIIAGEQDMQLYNAAVGYLNEATDIFNSFVHYRNERFRPYKTDAVLKQMLVPAGKLITEANEKLDRIGLLVENFQYDTEGIRRQLNVLKSRIEEQSEFINYYLAAAAGEREKLWYK